MNYPPFSEGTSISLQASKSNIYKLPFPFGVSNEPALKISKLKLQGASALSYFFSVSP
uniref:Uncharacterized protein n=1 Tax=Anguilla anguilla TaxID=7936 RepID=A0A0E9T405_ANGAN